MKDLIKQHFRLLALALLFFATGTPKAYCQTIRGYFIYGSMLIQEAESSSNKITLHTNKDYFFWVAEYGWITNFYNQTSYTITQGYQDPSYFSSWPYNFNGVDPEFEKPEGFEACSFRINSDKDEDVICCFKLNNGYFSISIHSITYDKELVKATCTTDGYHSVICQACGEENRQIFKATGHSFSEWQTMETGNGQFRTCSHDASHIQYDMDATGVNALELTLTDGTTLTYPYTLSPVVTFNAYDVAVSFDTGKTSLVNKTDITGYNQVWSHNKNLFPQNDDKTYSHQCDYEGCGHKHDDLFVKNAGQYYVAKKTKGVIRVADMTLNDNEGYDCEADITVSNVSYARDMTGNQWGTLCLPFAINPNAYSDCSFYQLSSVDNERKEIVLSRIDNQEIAAGTPVLVRRNAAVNGISISATDAEMANSIQAGSTAGEFTMVGTLKTSDDLANNAYIINNDKFWNVGELISNGKATTVKVGAFRSYLLANTTAPSAQARMLSLSIGDDDTTAIDVLNAADNSEAEIYDLNGHRLPDLQKGINIVKRGNKTTKVIIR
jgi:hypothetical protein